MKNNITLYLDDDNFVRFSVNDPNANWTIKNIITLTDTECEFDAENEQGKSGRFKISFDGKNNILQKQLSEYSKFVRITL